ncbi:hypothetical protein EYF80_038076 [Liparis tanakae]|uniref:Uncharacterized protein n=1 Tax=Liparis tanakae TaxID=230148 RepID=A0A4Z2GDR4_9TELE|nr:hypothetical protein EYF80_038076 [Liparis tanakae]
MKMESTFWLSLGSLADVSNSSMLWESANFSAMLEGTLGESTKQRGKLTCIWSTRSHLFPTRTRGTDAETRWPLHSCNTAEYVSPSSSTAFSRKSTPMVASVLSGKLPPVKRKVRQVLPTFESPMTMILKIRVWMLSSREEVMLGAASLLLLARLRLLALWRSMEDVRMVTLSSARFLRVFPFPPPPLSPPPPPPPLSPPPPPGARVSSGESLVIVPEEAMRKSLQAPVPVDLEATAEVGCWEGMPIRSDPPDSWFGFPFHSAIQKRRLVSHLYRCSMMVLEGSCQMVPLVDGVDSGQWRYTADPYIAETEWRRDGPPWRWVGGMGRGGGGGGWREKEGEFALTSSWTALLATPTALPAKHSYLWED